MQPLANLATTKHMSHRHAQSVCSKSTVLVYVTKKKSHGDTLLPKGGRQFKGAAVAE